MKKIDNMIRNEVYHPLDDIPQKKITNQLHFEIWNTVADKINSYCGWKIKNEIEEISDD